MGTRYILDIIPSLFLFFPFPPPYFFFFFFFFFLGTTTENTLVFSSQNIEKIEKIEEIEKKWVAKAEVVWKKSRWVEVLYKMVQESKETLVENEVEAWKVCLYLCIYIYIYIYIYIMVQESKEMLVEAWKGCFIFFILYLDINHQVLISTP